MHKVEITYNEQLLSIDCRYYGTGIEVDRIFWHKQIDINKTKWIDVTDLLIPDFDLFHDDIIKVLKASEEKDQFEWTEFNDEF